MPVAFEPNETLPYVLERHRHLPAEAQPTFIVRAMSRRLRRQWQVIAAKALELKRTRMDEKDLLKVIEIDATLQNYYTEMIEMGVVGWKNIPGDFSKEALTEYLDSRIDDGDCEELAFEWTAAFVLMESDRKNLSPLSPSDAGSSIAPTTTAASV